MRRFLPALLLILAMPAGRTPCAESVRDDPPPAFDFDSGAQNWDRGLDTLPLDCVAVPSETGRAASLPFSGGDSVTLRLKREIDLSRCEALRFRIRLPKVSAHMHVALYLVGARDTWYQTWRPIRPETGEWQVIRIDLSRDAGLLEPVGHAKPWGPYSAQRIGEVGIQVFADRAVEGDVLVDDVEFVPREGIAPGNELYDYEVSSDKVGRYERFEVTFELSRTYDNPYDPSQIEVIGEFTSPDGTLTTVPGFFYQGYERRLDKKEERLIPVGSPKWKVRFAPREVGTYTYRLIIRDGDVLTTTPLTFECVASSRPGYVRVSSDPRYFEFTDGSFFYPIGHNIPATFNVKAAEMLGVSINQLEGTFAFDRYLERMSGAGENFGRVWLGAWSFGLEWSHAYHPAYEGLGRYNQENAWRLDYVLDRAENLGVYLQVALTTFGHWRSSVEKEGDWELSPYNKTQGGPLNRAEEFWGDASTQAIYQRMVRYVMARWGYSSQVASWELCNEVDLVTQFGRQLDAIREWHVRSAKTIRTFDPNAHLTTTNFASAPREPSILKLPEVSYSSTNHYRPQIVDEMRMRIFPEKSSFNKPALMTECGQDFKGTSPESTTSYLHIGLWGSYMIPFAGSGMPWWWDFIDDRNLYAMFTPLVEFARGEDRRNRNLNSADGLTLDAAGQALEDLPALALQNDHDGYFWVYERGMLRAEGAALFVPRPRSNVTLQLSGLADGTYRAEFWDTWKGGKLSELTADAKDGTLRLPVPEFTNDIAGKFRRLEGTSAEQKRSE